MTGTSSFFSREDIVEVMQMHKLVTVQGVQVSFRTAIFLLCLEIRMLEQDEDILK